MARTKTPRYVRFTRSGDGALVSWFQLSGAPVTPVPTYWCLWSTTGLSRASTHELQAHETATRSRLERTDFDEAPDELLVLLAKTALLGDLTN